MLAWTMLQLDSVPETEIVLSTHKLLLQLKSE